MIPQRIVDLLHASKSLPFRSMTFFNFLLEATVAGSVLILVMLVLRMVFRKRIGSRLVYLAWLLVAIRLLVPIALPNPLMDQFRPTYSTDGGARPVADQIRVRYHDAVFELSQSLTLGAPSDEISPARRTLADLTLKVAAYTSYGWMGKTYLLLYGVGALAAAGVFAVRNGRFRRRLRRDSVSALEGEQLALYQALCRDMGVRELPVVYVDPLPSPCLAGVFKPVIALPLALPPDGLSDALAHELCHYKARDSWWALLRCVCCAVHWFNPLVWLAQRLVKTDCELACDERVARRLTPEQRLHYANTLVITAKQAYAPRAGVLATGMTMTGKRLKARIDALIRMRGVQRVAAGVVAVVLVALTVAAFSTAESVEQTKRMTTCQSAFPMSVNDVYPTPDYVFGEPVALAQLNTLDEAEAQAKRYLNAMYPEDRDRFDGFRYRIQKLGDRGWEVAVFAPESEETPYCYMELRASGRIVSAHRYLPFYDEMPNTEDLRYNRPSELPGNLKDVALAFANELGAVALQGASFQEITTFGDYDTAEGRFVDFELYDADHTRMQISLRVQIVPEFRFKGLYCWLGADDLAKDRETPIEQGTHKYTYTADPSITFDAVFWGDTDSTYVLSPDAVLTEQEALDYAVSVMLEKSGLTKEQLTSLGLEYGYYDHSNYEGTLSWWRVSFPVDDADQNRYYVGFEDSHTRDLNNLNFSRPGEGVG